MERAGRPRTVIRIDAATFEGVRGGTIPPLQALMDGRLKIEGDRALAMQLLLLVGIRRWVVDAKLANLQGPGQLQDNRGYQPSFPGQQPQWGGYPGQQQQPPYPGQQPPGGYPGQPPR